MDQPAPFTIVTGSMIEDIMRGHHAEIISVVANAYGLHHAGHSVNPDSYFLRFPDKPQSRIIALPAYLGGDVDLAGIKWIASFPENTVRNLQRASAVLILNDYRTGYPLGVLEASRISAHRTAASAALGARALHPGTRQIDKLCVIGAGVIARHIVDYLLADGWSAGEVAVHDLRREDAHAFAGWVEARANTRGVVAESATDACRDAALIVLATTAGKPHLLSPEIFAHRPTILNISLRDIDPDILLDAQNVLDDLAHCLKADTSPHLAEQRSGGSAFVSGTIADVIAGRVLPDEGRARIFSPFGLGILDIALGHYVLTTATRTGRSLQIDDFFAETNRW